MADEPQEPTELEKWEQRYINTFASTEGNMVLMHIVTVVLGFVNPILTEEDRIKHNAAREIMLLSGGWEWEKIKRKKR